MMNLVSMPAAVAVPRCRYQDPDTTLTLAEGLAEYRAAHPELFDPTELSAQKELGDLGRFFAAHDACHVLFGLDTSLGDEALADTWTLCATDVKWAELRSYYRNEDQKKFFNNLIRDIGWWAVTRHSIAAIPRVLRALWRSRKMPKRWELHNWAAHLDVPLFQLCAQYNIRLV